MTINSTTRKVGPFLMDGIAVVYAFPFKVLNATDILAVWYNGEAEQDLVYNQDYSVTLNSDQNANPGGTVNLSAALASGTTLIITSDQPDLQPTDYTNQGGFYPETVTTSLDRACIDIQELQEQADRSLRFPISDPPLDAVLPPANQRAGYVLVFESDGSIGTSQPLAVKAFSGALLGSRDGVNTIFTLTDDGTPIGVAPIEDPIVWNNIPLIPGSGYTYGPDIDQVTFAVAPDPSDVLWGQGYIYFGAPVQPESASDKFFSGDLLGPQNLVNTVFTLTDNGTPLTMAPAQVFVWQNFPLAPGVGYTLGPGPNQVTFTNPPKPTDVLYAQGILSVFSANVLAGAQDPNTLTTAGIYYLPDGMAGPNIPQPPHTWNSKEGVLEVFNYTPPSGDSTHTQYVMQRYQTGYDFQFAPGEIFVRWYTNYSGSLGWTPWVNVGNIGTCINTAATADLNTFTEAGTYYFPFGTGPNTPNPPTGAINSNGSILEVLSYSNAAYNPYILQRFTLSQDCWSGAAPGRFFERWNWISPSGNVWSSWFYYLPAGTA